MFRITEFVGAPSPVQTAEKVHELSDSTSFLTYSQKHVLHNVWQCVPRLKVKVEVHRIIFWAHSGIQHVSQQLTLNGTVLATEHCTRTCRTFIVQSRVHVATYIYIYIANRVGTSDISCGVYGLRILGPPLGSSGHSSWLPIRRPGFDSRHYQTDRATAACRINDCQHLKIEGATWSAWRIPTAVFSVF
jgi:hypothetical protein